VRIIVNGDKEAVATTVPDRESPPRCPLDIRISYYIRRFIYIEPAARG